MIVRRIQVWLLPVGVLRIVWAALVLTALGTGASAQTIPASVLQNLPPSLQAQLPRQLGDLGEVSSGLSRITPKPDAVTPDKVKPVSLRLPVASTPNKIIGFGDVLEVWLQPADASPDADRTPLVYRVAIDQEGMLRVPGAPAVPVVGLSAAQATQLLAGLPGIGDSSLRLTVLPATERLSGLGVRPFGYQLFSNPSALRSDPLMPIPEGYVIGPGDLFLIQMFGSEQGDYEQAVTRDGTVVLPRFGPIQVAGLPFEKARKAIQARVSKQAIGVETSVTLGPLRSIRVWVVGDVARPGPHRVTAVAAPLDALFAAGGVQSKGSLRQIKVRRDGRDLATIDLYQLLLNGRGGSHLRLSQDDVIFVPPVSAQVSVAGEVHRPGTYELLADDDFAEVLKLAGGIATGGNRASIRLQRLDPRFGQQVFDLGPSELSRLAKDGDVLRVFPLHDRPFHGVTLRGSVVTPGVQPWRPGMRLLDLLPPTAIAQDADLHYVLIRRQSPVGTGKHYLQADLISARAQPASEHNPLLVQYDEVELFSRHQDRAALLAVETQALAQSAEAGRVQNQTVMVSGLVRFSGRYPLTEGMRVSDLLKAAGSVTERAYLPRAELIRFSLAEDGQSRITHRRYIDLQQVLAGVAGADLPLRSDDRVMVRATPDWQGDLVKVAGEVIFPGTYVMTPGETLGDLIERAGGLTRDAFLQGSVFTRNLVREREQRELDRLANEFENEMVRIAASPEALGRTDGQGKALLAGQQLLARLKSVKAAGRLSVQLTLREDGRIDGESDLALMDGDVLTIPRRPDSVAVVGEVYHATAHRFRDGQSVRNYLKQSGGINRRGDRRHVLLVHANGSVSSVSLGWLRSGGKVTLGDTVVVPLRIRTFSGLKLVTDITQIMYQLALTAASAKAIGVF